MSVVDSLMAGYSSASWANRCARNGCITKDTPPPFNPTSTTFGYTPDNPGDIRLCREALKDFEVLNHPSVVGDGVEAMAFLRREGKYIDASRPDLILLDLNLPRKDGREVLTEIKVDEQLKRIPVVILTTSGAEQDILNTYEHHANCYIKKPIDLDQF
ncbi:MAG: response regulator, partial [Singulisphaera sp.]|nr:response regulator [Singulisphaera sp.]